MINGPEELKTTNGSQGKKRTKNRKPVNKWKIAFLTMIALIALSFLVLTVKLTSTNELNEQQVAAFKEQKGTKALSLHSNKQEMNSIINYYLENYLQNSNSDYHFTLKNQAILDGQVSIFRVPVNYYLYFDPYVMENGNIQLRAKSISIGTLGVPIKEVLKLVKSSYKLPDYVEINPTDKTVIVRLDQLKLKNGMSVKANKIDLVDDAIEASLYLPTSDKK